MCNACYIRWRKAQKPKVIVWCRCGQSQVRDRRSNCSDCSKRMRAEQRKRESVARKKRFASDEEYRRRHIESSKRSAAKRVEKRRAYARERARKLRSDPAYLKSLSATVRESRQRDPERHWGYELRKRGMTRSEYLALLEKQGGVCAICKRSCKSGRRLAIDHCHKTSKVRGLLCAPCNTALGLMQEDIQIFSVAARYLLKAGAC